jgi:hypothetical protein
MATATGYEKRMAVIQIALGGVSGETTDGVHVTFYDRRLQPYFGEVIDGGFILDKRAALLARPGLAIGSPMVKGSLPPGTVDRFADRCPLYDVADSIVLDAIRSDPTNPAAGLATLMQDDPACGGCDEVATDVYADGWGKRWARVGRRFGRVVVWDDGQTEQIRPFERRYLRDDDQPDLGDDELPELPRAA